MLQDAATEINWIRMDLVFLNGVITSTIEILESCFPTQSLAVLFISRRALL